ncbi:MAG: phosphoribosylamine--glycine ligase [Chloroflexota bacterium]|nr:phosphoribosylamine--glycine ligase [Chloroflexota bacterium]
MRYLVQPTRILVVGGGAREHALAWKLGTEPGVNEVVVAPGSDAIGREPRVRVAPGVNPLDPAAILALARERAVELVVIGPEAPLAAGVADSLTEAGIPVFGPSAAAARIETSKAFCREVAEAAGVPMARGRVFEVEERRAAIEYATELAVSGGIVVKEDGLAAGKGVTVCDTADEAAPVIAAMDARFVVEERLVGPEASVIALADGRIAFGLPIARDHKRLGDVDTGPNTGGMGAISPIPDLSDTAADDLVVRFHLPILAELARRGSPFRGALYAGLMLTDDGPRLLEFNARFGDPETQAILPRLAGPLGPLLLAAARGALPHGPAALQASLPGATVAIVLASGGYPATPTIGDRIEGVEEAAADGALVFHAATRATDDRGWTTAGGRVLTVVGLGLDAGTARLVAECAANRISWPGMQRRHDIGVSPAAPVGAGR